MTTNTTTSSGAWRVERLDLGGYLGRLGISAREPGRAALDELHERHVRTFTFDNADVLLGRHPGVDLDAVQEKFVGRGRGGYCFEHSTLLAAALERLGYTVIRRLARVGDPGVAPVNGRTHLVVEVVIDGRRLLCDPGFGLSITRPILLEDGHAEEQYGNAFRIVKVADGVVPAWRLERLRNGAWEVQHTTDELPVRPADVELGHHWTSTSPSSHFTSGLIVAKRLPGRHVTLTAGSVTVRHDDGTTEHHDLAPGELAGWLGVVDPHLSGDETDQLLARLATVGRDDAVGHDAGSTLEATASSASR